MYLDYNLDIDKKSKWKIANTVQNNCLLPFKINESGIFYAKRKYYTERYAKNDFQIIYTVEGVGSLSYLNNKYLLKSGSLVILDCNEYHKYKTHEDYKNWTFYWIHVGGDFCKTYYDAVYKNGFKIFDIGIDIEYIDLFKIALRQIEYTTETSKIILNDTVSRIYTKIISKQVTKEVDQNQYSINKSIKYISSNFDKNINIDEIAKEVNISKYYFIKIFHEYTGMTPYNYLINCRINESKKLLRTTNYKIQDICQRVGYGDTSNFSKAFVKVNGVTPGKYRKDSK
ncbi:MAG: AraC family transcriptional regulator [Lachnospirales bacterium]